MTTQAVALFTLFSLSLAPERPVRNPPTPNGPQPEFATIQAIDPEQKRVEFLQTETVMIPVTVAVLENGRQTTRTVFRQEYRMTRRVFALAKDAVYNAAGKKVSAQDALKRMKVGDTVLLATQPVDPLYLRVIRPDTLILVGSQPPVPIPIPLPKIPDARPKR
jgi:hypothetical protein